MRTHLTLLILALTTLLQPSITAQEYTSFERPIASTENLLPDLDKVDSTLLIPLPEHPRPDFERINWINLNGTWQFTFDQEVGQQAAVRDVTPSFDQEITVPFGWGSPLSGVANEGNKGYYARDVFIPSVWRNQRIFLVIGACEYDTQIYFNGRLVGSHQGGYTPIEVELTYSLTGFDDVPQHLLIIADDTPDDRRPTGKQGYGDVRGIWQTVYLEPRGQKYIDYVHFSPYIDNSIVKVEVGLSAALANNEGIRLHFPNGEEADYFFKPEKYNQSSLVQSFLVNLHNQHLWSLDDPYLYRVEVSLTRDYIPRDVVKTYWGQRNVGVAPLPGTEFPYITLNGKPVYLQMTLDQSYHPEGYYTYPTDEAMRRDIEITKELGLNGNRIHVKVEVPRKLFYADSLGVLIMQDTPNWWAGENEYSHGEWERVLRGQIRRDFNHPSIFAWVNFNETWGLITTRKADGFSQYHWLTQRWVEKMYTLTKTLDPTRLCEDNSPCNQDHVITDINSWHAYLPGNAWDEKIEEYCKNTVNGSIFNYIGGHHQTNAPLINSECGNVWGYEGATGDVDITWDYHQMINAFRRHPQCAGWIYTEHHDVINEWNGYVRADRTPKVDGLDEFVPGMTMRDFHAPYYISPRCPLIQDVKAGGTVTISNYLSVITDVDPGGMTLETSLAGWDDLGQPIDPQLIANAEIPFTAYAHEILEPLTVTAPQRNGLYVVRFILRDGKGDILHRNFVLLHVKGGTTAAGQPNLFIRSFTPTSYTQSEWSIRENYPMNGQKANGFGSGYFEYKVTVPDNSKLKRLKAVTLIFEASAKRFNGKDERYSEAEGDFMRGAGIADPGGLPNSYPQTDMHPYPSRLAVRVNNKTVTTIDLPDDPADHRGALSWQAQGDSRTLDEAGSHGYLQQVTIPTYLAKPGETLTIRFEILDSSAHGLAIYGAGCGQYALDPTIVFEIRDKNAALPVRSGWGNTTRPTKRK
ncbi:MAG: glycoside hydrolase family 2 [Prevotella sp.]|nr:glycoside hydrolase family 2 [Prevotella sp.]